MDRDLTRRRAELIATLRARGFGDDADELASYVLPSALMTLTELHAPAAIGATRVGGIPDVPQDFAWPRCDGVPMIFVAQIRLSDLAELPCGVLLPQNGALLFFFGAGRDPRERDACRVFHVGEARSELAPAVVPGDLPGHARLPSRGVSLEPDRCVPPWESPHYEGLFGDMLEWSDERTAMLNDYFAENGTSADTAERVFRLLGHPDPLEGDLYTMVHRADGVVTSSADRERAIDAREGTAREWRLLLQIDSAPDQAWTWGDSRRIYFFVRQQDLEGGRFDRARVALQSN